MDGPAHAVYIAGVPPTPPHEPSPFAPGTSRRATLDAAVARLLPDDADATGVADVVVAKLALLPAHDQADLARALDLLGSPLAALAATGRPVRFARLPPPLQVRVLASWERSPLPPLRTVFQALRRLALALYYATPAAHARIGYLGPLHLRQTAFAWEGAAGDALPDDGPVARVGDLVAMHEAARALTADRPSRPRVDPFALVGPPAPLAPLAPPRARGAPPEHHDTSATRDDHHHSVAGWRVPSPHASAWSRPGAVLTAADLRDGATLKADVVVIGTGAGGAVAACRLAEAGRDVLLLEEGSLLRGDQLDEREAELTERLYADNGLRATDDLSMLLFQGRAVGGGSTVNWLIMLRPRDGVLDEWRERFGLDYAVDAMTSQWDRIEREVHARVVPDDAHSPNNRIVLDGAHALGWSARAGAINARGCVRSGFCGQGCRYDAKQGTLQVYLPRALAAGARLVAEAHVDRIEVPAVNEPTGERRLANLPPRRVHVTLRDPVTRQARGRVTVAARVVVLAAGAVGTPVLLQRSGLGGGAVGRYLRLHPTVPVSGIYDRPIYGAAGIPLSALCDEFHDMDGRGYGAWIECPPTHPSLAAVAQQGFGRAHAEAMSHFVNLGTLIALVRDGAERERSSGSVTVDRAGRVRIAYRLTPTDARHVVRGMQAAARLHLAAGAREVRTVHVDPVVIRSERDVAAIAARSLAPNRIGLFSAHVNGTCRMGTDPRTSGTRTDGQRHGVAGVYVADGSLLPTAPGVNPQETIMALASVIGEGIAGKW